MADINSLTNFLPNITQQGMMNMLITLMSILLVLAATLYIMFRVLKYRYPVEIWKFDDHGHFQIVADKAALKQRDGVTKIQLAKAKKQQIFNHFMYPLRSGSSKRTKDKIYLTEENGALRGLLIQKQAQFFDANGNFLTPEQVFFEDDNKLIPLSEADLITQDGSEVYAQSTPILSPANNDSNNAFTLELLEKVTKYHIPQWYEKLQYVAVIMAGIVAGVIVYIINRSGG